MLIPGRKSIAEENRGRKQKADENGAPNGMGKRSSSISSGSSTSVSTISTKLSRSPTPSFERAHLSRSRTSIRKAELGKRRRSTSSSSSYISEASSTRLREARTREDSRNTRRRRSSNSPDSRGRERHYQNNGINDRPGHGRRPRRVSRSLSLSTSSESSLDQRRKHRLEDGERNTVKRWPSESPDPRRQDQVFRHKRSHGRIQSRGESRDRSEVARSRRSMSPGARLRQDRKYQDSPPRERSPHASHDNDRYGSSFRGLDNSRAARFAQPSGRPQKERSLSPFSKRLALTQAMNMGK